MKEKENDWETVDGLCVEVVPVEEPGPGQGQEFLADPPAVVCEEKGSQDERTDGRAG